MCYTLCSLNIIQRIIYLKLLLQNVLCLMKSYIRHNVWYNIMEKLVFKIVKKPTKKGDNYYFNIPIEFLRSGRIDPDKEYEVLVYEIENINTNNKK